jgi:hypothetical protein
MEITFRLMQESGVPGPKKTITLENPDPHPNVIARLAREWAAGEAGHPWDCLTYEMNGETVEVHRQNA